MVTQAICIKNVQVDVQYGSLFTVCCDRRGDKYEKHVVHRTTNKRRFFSGIVDRFGVWISIHTLYSIEVS